MHLRSLAALGMATAIALLALLSTPSASLAHERRTIGGGKYDVVVGWDTEPAYVNQRNSVGIRISRPGTNPAEAVTGAEKTLEVSIRQGAESRSFQLRPVFGQPGYYVVDLVPTRAGDYVWTFTGSIGADQINETFDSANGKFDPVAASSGIEFPLAAPDPADINAQLQAANSVAERATFVAYLGAGLGVLGCVLALLAWLTRPRQRSGVLSSRDAAVRRVPGAGL